MTSREGCTRGPLLSVIVPVYSSARELKQCLAALANSDFRDHEVLVVDDGSAEPVALLADKHGFKSIPTGCTLDIAAFRLSGARSGFSYHAKRSP